MLPTACTNFHSFQMCLRTRARWRRCSSLLSRFEFSCAEEKGGIYKKARERERVIHRRRGMEAARHREEVEEGGQLSIAFTFKISISIGITPLICITACSRRQRCCACRNLS